MEKISASCTIQLLTLTLFPWTSTVLTVKSTPMVFCCLEQKIPDLKLWTTQVFPTLESPVFKGCQKNIDSINGFHYETGKHGFISKARHYRNRDLRLLFYMFNSLLFDDDHKTPVLSRPW